MNEGSLRMMITIFLAIVLNPTLPNQKIIVYVFKCRQQCLIVLCAYWTIIVSFNMNRCITENTSERNFAKPNYLYIAGKKSFFLQSLCSLVW